MLVWLTLPFMIFAVFDPSLLTVCINCSFYIYSYIMVRNVTSDNAYILQEGEAEEELN